MPSRQDDVRAILDQVEADGRTSLTAPDAKLSVTLTISQSPRRDWRNPLTRLRLLPIRLAIPW